MFDFKQKQIFIFDLDDTLINTTKATEMGMLRAYEKLSCECMGNFDKFPTFEEFNKNVYEIYRKNDKQGKKRRDIDAEVWEDYCTGLREYGFKLKHYEHSLAARLFYHFKETKNGCLMTLPGAFELLNKINVIGSSYCVTEGNCNYQHTKAIITEIEAKVESVKVLENDKVLELKGFVEDLRKPAETMVMIGDSEADVDAGITAGINTVCVRTGHGDYSKFEKKADLVVDNLWELLCPLK